MAPLIGINRHRIGIDGEGITTLVAFHGCPLRCRYCINKQCWSAEGIVKTVTPEQLYEEVRQDELYFLASGGGITFGGGEPLLHPDFIAAFAQLPEDPWHITVETSLCVDKAAIDKVIPYVHEFIIDVKDIDDVIYKRYTGQPNGRVLLNLWHMSQLHFTDRCTIRLPLIPEYNTDTNRDMSEQWLRDMGFTRIERFNYTIK